MSVDARMRLVGEDATAPAFSSVERRLQAMQAKGQQLAGALKGAFAAIGGAAIIGTLTRAVTAVSTAAMEAERSYNQFAGTLRATGGVVGMTVGQLEDLTDSLTRSTTFDDDSIRDAMTTLLRFRTIQGETFERAIRLSADLAAALGIDLSDAAQKVGRALVDGTRGVRGLVEAGVKFGGRQAELLKKLEQTGDRARANKLVLDELARSVGGQAGDINTGLYGASRRATVAWGELLEALGKLPAVQSSTQGGLNIIADALDHVRENIEAVGRAQRGLAQLRAGGGQLPALEPGKLPGGRKMPSQEDVTRTLELLRKSPLDPRDISIDMRTGRIIERSKVALAEEKPEKKGKDPNKEREALEAELMRRSERAQESILYGIEEGERLAAERSAATTEDIIADIERRREAEAQAQAQSLAGQDAVLERLRERDERFRSLVDGYQAEIDALGEVSEATRVIRDIERGRYQDLTDAQREQLVSYAAQLDVLREQADELERGREFARSFGAAMASAAEEAIVKWEGFGKLLQGLEQDLIRLITKRLVTEPLAELVGNLFSGEASGGSGGGGIFGMIGSVLGRLFGGGKAVGGDVERGRFYLVGERGPELVRMRAPGTVIPAARTKALLQVQGAAVGPRLTLIQGGARAAAPGPASRVPAGLSRARLGPQQVRIDGARADGGPVAAGGTYEMGERGLELVHMRRAFPHASAETGGERTSVYAPITIVAPNPQAFRASSGQIAADIDRTLRRAAR